MQLAAKEFSAFPGGSVSFISSVKIKKSALASQNQQTKLSPLNKQVNKQMKIGTFY